MTFEYTDHKGTRGTAVTNETDSRGTSVRVRLVGLQDMPGTLIRMEVPEGKEPDLVEAVTVKATNATTAMKGFGKAAVNEKVRCSCHCFYF